MYPRLHIRELLLTHSIIDADKPLKKGFFIPFDSSTNVRSCLLSGHKPLSENIVFLVSNSQSAHTLLKTKLIEICSFIKECRKLTLDFGLNKGLNPTFQKIFQC